MACHGSDKRLQSINLDYVCVARRRRHRSVLDDNRLARMKKLKASRPSTEATAIRPSP